MFFWRLMSAYDDPVKATAIGDGGRDDDYVALLASCARQMRVWQLSFHARCQPQMQVTVGS
jgi:hypothetical protein